MKKKFAFLLGTLLLGATPSITAKVIDLNSGIIDPHSSDPGGNREPTNIPNVDLTNDVLTFQASHADFALQVLDENGVVVYSTAVPSTQTTVILPSWLSGEFELRLYPTGSNLYFYGWIEL